VGKGTWLLDGVRLRALRMARMMTIHVLATKAGVAERTVADAERKGQAEVRPETIRCLAKALGVAPEELLVGATTASAAAAPPPPPPAPSRPAITTAIPPPKHVARTRLDVLGDLRRERGAPSTVVVGKARVEVFDARHMQDILARHAAFKGKRFVVEGKLDVQRALLGKEARAFGAKDGVGLRVEVLVDVAPRETLSVTVHAPTAKLAAALQSALKKSVRLVVALRVVGKNDERVVSLFASPRKRAWALVVQRVIRGATSTTRVVAGARRAPRSPPRSPMPRRRFRRRRPRRTCTRRGPMRTRRRCPRRCLRRPRRRRRRRSG
jgi:transcriptional regulator with XRE-family HTH domain